MKIKGMLVFLSLSVVISVGAQASGQEPDEKILQRSSVTESKVAPDVQAELNRREIARNLAQIKSRADLDVYLKATPINNSPFSKLSSGARHRFTNSITFNEGGITGFSYSDLTTELSVSEIHEVLSLFGAQHLSQKMSSAKKNSALDNLILRTHSVVIPMIRADHEGYSCEGNHTCVRDSDHICMTGC